MKKTRSYVFSSAKTVVFDTAVKKAYAASADEIYEGADVFAYCYPAYNEYFVVVYDK